MRIAPSYKFFSPFLLVISLVMGISSAQAQEVPDTIPLKSDTIIEQPELGPNDTIQVHAKILDGKLMPAGTMEWIWVTAPAPPGMKARLKEWTRLRNAVYVTYPYAKKAGVIINEMNSKLSTMSSKSDRKAYIKSKESALKKEFTDPLSNLSVYQGKVLMKLINRQTGNNCYELIKEYKGGITARLYQTVAFFFSSNLKQPYDSEGDDKVIESIVQEVERMHTR